MVAASGVQQAGKSREMIVVSLAFWTESSEHPGGHLPPNECWETCVVTVRKKDNPSRPLIWTTSDPIPATHLADIPVAVKTALSKAGVTIHDA